MRGLEMLLQSAPAQPAVYLVVVNLVAGHGAAGRYPLSINAVEPLTTW